jgi:parallel beta-helix repeat protein
MKYLLFFFGISSIYACDQIFRQKRNKTEPLADESPITIKKNKDTLILTTKTDNLNKQATAEEIKPYKKQPATVTVTEPNTALKKILYLSLPEGTPATYKNISNVIIENLQFTNKSGANLMFINCKDITIRNCYFGRSGAEAIVLEKCSNVRVEKCLFAYNLTGVYAATSSTIKVINNQFVNARQRSDPARGQFVQFNNVTGAGNEISDNKGENFPGESNPEDLISMFKSSGTAASPIRIKNNMFRGGGPSASGGGIVLGDHGGRFIVAENNTLLNPGQYGMAVAGGSDMAILNNKIYARQQPFTNNPLFVWAQAGVSCSDIIVKDNRANWIDKKGNINGGWDAGNCKNTSFEYPALITAAEMNVPEHLIDFVTSVELLKIRGKNK